jgi:hypothetical protein
LGAELAHQLGRLAAFAIDGEGLGGQVGVFESLAQPCGRGVSQGIER